MAGEGGPRWSRAAPEHDIICLHGAAKLAAEGRGGAAARGRGGRQGAVPAGGRGRAKGRGGAGPGEGAEAALGSRLFAGRCQPGALLGRPLSGSSGRTRQKAQSEVKTRVWKKF